ncbi:MAG: SAM-dependent methyltransferase [Paludibacter sp.]|nr:SAM-dependent methyltransferase [Paludibacter sp.]
MNNQINLFLEKLQLIIEKKELIKLSLTGKRVKSSDLKKVIITAVEIKKGYCLNFVNRHDTKDITKNYEIQEGVQLINQLLETDFLNAEVFSKNENFQLFILPNGKVRLKMLQPTMMASVSLSHNREKERLIQLQGNIYLQELGITNAGWEVRREMSDKYTQINQYIELLAPYLDEIQLTDNFDVVDMGSGKGYLTFALYDFLANKLKLTPKMTGVEYREDLVNICNSIAEKSGFENLNFVQGTIEKTKLDKIDILIALHACDTATDEAIFRGIKSEADLIVCAPCCHKQIRKAMNVTNELNNITRFGILKERQAEIITDTIRAMILELNGYKTNVFQFISLEHTPKNVMIVGKKVKNNSKNKEQIKTEIDSIKKLYGIEKHYLETLLEM